jgi:hypothetical protein
MSDLNDFFAKKDKRKKKPLKAAPKATAAVPDPSDSADADVSANGNGAPAENSADAPAASAGQKPAVPARSAKDDGWIELDDERTAKVNTGGRTVADFNKRETDEKEANGGDDAPTEKFSGWTAGDKGGEDGEGAPTEVGAAPVAAFPSLADTADAPKVPKNPGGGGGGVARPRYGGGGGGFAALKKKLEAMKAAEAEAAAKGVKPAPN